MLETHMVLRVVLADPGGALRLRLLGVVGRLDDALGLLLTALLVQLDVILRHDARGRGDQRQH